MNIEDIRRKLQSRSHLRNVKIQPRIRNKEPTLKIESRSRSGDITYTCTRCKLLFFTFSSLDAHRENCQRERERHTREREAEYKCPEIGCLKVFLRTSTLKEHKNTHSRSSLNPHPDKYSNISYQNKNSTNVSHMKNPNEFSQKDPNEFSRKQYRNKFSLKQNPRDLSNRPPSRDFRQKHILRNFSQAREQFSRPWNTQHPKTNPRYNNQYRQKYAREFSRSVSRNYDFNHNKQEKYLRQKESSPDQYLNASRDFSPNLVQIPNLEEYRSMLNNQKYKPRSSTNLNSNLKPYTSDTCKERKSDFKSFGEHLMNPIEEKNPKMVVDLDEEIIVDSKNVEMEEKKPTNVDLVDTEDILDLEETAAAISRELEELKWLDGEILDEYKEKNMNTLNYLQCQSNEVVEREIYFSHKVVGKEKEGEDMSDSVKEKPKIMVDLEEGEIVDSEDEDMGEKEAHSESPDDVRKIIIKYRNMLNNKKYEYNQRNKQTSSLEKIPNYANLKKTSNLIVIPYKCDLCEERKSDFQSFQVHLMSHLEEKQPKVEIHPEEGGKVDSEDDQMEETENEEMDGKEYECSIEKYQHHKIPSLFCLSLIQAYADEPYPSIRSSTSDSLSAQAPRASLTDKGSSQNDLLSNNSPSPNDFTNVSPSNESSPATDSVSACLTSASGVENREHIGPGLSLIQAYASPDHCPSPSYLGNVSPPNDSSATDSSSTDSSSECFTSSPEKKERDKDETDIPTSVDSVDTEDSLDDKILDEYKEKNANTPPNNSSSATDSSSSTDSSSACFTSSPEKKGRDKDETDIPPSVDSVDTEETVDLEAISTRELEDKILDEYKAKNANTLNNLHCLSNEVVEREIYFSNKVVENENEGVDVSGIVEKMIQEDINVCTDLKKEFLQNKMHGLKSEFKEKNLNILSGLHLHNNEVIKGMGDNIPVDVPTNIKMDVIENKATSKLDSIANMEMSNSDLTEYVEDHTWTLLENIAIPKCDFVELENIETPKRDFVENIEWPKWNFSENIGPLKWDLIEYIDIPQHDVIQDSVALPEITPKMEKMIQKALKSRKKVLVDRHNIQIGARDIRNLAGLNWLNDEIINFYLQMIVERGARTGVKIHAYSTFFYPKLLTGGHTSLRRWTKKVDIFAQDLLLIPVHLGIHWSLAVVDFGKSGVFYYDSMGGDNPDCFAAILNYLQDEHRIKKEAELDVAYFEARTLKGVPQQMNGSDCGVFLLKFAEYVSRGADLNFTQKDMPTFRKIIIWEILNDQLLQ